MAEETLLTSANSGDIGALMLKSALRELEQFFRDPEVVEIMLNPDRHLWIEKLGQQCQDTGIVINEEDSTRFIKLVASYCKTIITDERPIISAELPYLKSRFEALMPPIVDSPVFSIRQPATKIFRLDDYVRDKIMTPLQTEIIRKAVADKQNIIFVGGTGTGKTTATNAVLDVIADTGDRIVILQDTKELKCSAPNVVFLRTSDFVDMNRLLKSTMRLRPDRIVVGEVRDAAALTLLKAWNTGHPGGISTIHANSAYGGLLRLEQLIQEAVPTPQEALIGDAVDLIIYLERCYNSEQKKYGRIVKEMAYVNGFSDGKYNIEYI